MAALNNRDLLRGVLLILISLAFGLMSFRYPVGEIERAGPGLFPRVVSGLLLLVGVATVIRSRFAVRVPLDFNIKNVALIGASLLGFVIMSEAVNMMVGITVLVFCASFAVPAYSITRNLKISAGLIVVAFAFQKLFGLELGLF